MRSILRTEGNADAEVLLLEARRHVLTLMPAFLFVLVSFLLAVSIGKMGVMSLIVSSGFFVFTWYSRELNVFVVTTERVIEEKGVYSLDVRECNLERINNVNVKQTVTGRMIGYGDIDVQTAAEHGSIELKTVSSPAKIRSAIMDAVNCGKKSAARRDMQEIAGIIADSIKKSNDKNGIANENGISRRDLNIAVWRVFEEYGMVPPDGMVGRIVNEVTKGGS